MLRAATLLAEVAGAVVDGGIVTAGEGAARREAVLVRPSRVNAMLGQSWSDERIQAVLTALGATAVRVADGLMVTPPSHRHDLGREVDFVEEVARVVGYEQIAPAMPMVELMPVAVPGSVRAAVSLRSLLSGLGLSEHVGVSFASEPNRPSPTCAAVCSCLPPVNLMHRHACDNCTHPPACRPDRTPQSQQAVHLASSLFSTSRTATTSQHQHDQQEQLDS
jgi:hypothetical protein